ESEVLGGSLDHPLGRENFRLPDRRGRFDIDNDRILNIDQVVRGVSKERLSAVGASPACCWIGRRDELGNDLGRGSKRCIVLDGQILKDGPARSFGANPFSPSMPFCRFASALIRLASTAKLSPPTSPWSMQRRKMVSNSRRSRSLSRKRPCRFFEKVEWSGTSPSSPRRQNQRYARFRWTSSHQRRSDRMPKQYPTSSIRIINSGAIEGRPIVL